MIITVYFTCTILITSLLSTWPISLLILLLIFTLCYLDYLFNVCSKFSSWIKIWNPKFNFNFNRQLHHEVYIEEWLNDLNWLNQWTVMNSIYVPSNLSFTNFNRIYELNFMSCFTYATSCCFFTCATFFSARYLRSSIEQYLSLFNRQGAWIFY